MAHRYAGGSSKKPVIIIAAVIAVIAVAVVAIVFAVNSGKDGNTGETTQPISSVAQTVAATTVAGTQSKPDSSEPDQSVIETEQPQSSDGSQASQSDPDGGESSATQNIVVPTKGTGEASFFNATYIPYKAIDADSGEEVTLREVFGSSYAQGVLTFNSDGSFTDSMYVSEPARGAYVVEGEDISATYSDDKNMQISVNEWENGAPKDFVVNYGGYDVYFQ